MDAATGDFCSATVPHDAEVHPMLCAVLGFFSGTAMDLLCKAVIQLFQLINKMQHCIMQSSCSAGTCPSYSTDIKSPGRVVHPCEEMLSREGSRRSPRHVQAGGGSPACSGVLPSPDQPLAFDLCHPLLSASPNLGTAQPVPTCPLSS